MFGTFEPLTIFLESGEIHITSVLSVIAPRPQRFSNAEMLQSSLSQSLVCIAKRTRAAQSSYQANYQSYQSNALEDNSETQAGIKESSNSTVTYKGRVLSVTNVFRKNGFGQTLLHMAAKEGNTHMVHQILKFGAEVNIADYAGNAWKTDF